MRYCVIECHYLALGNALAPPVHVEKVVADRQSYSLLKDLHLPPRTLDLEIEYDSELRNSAEGALSLEA